MELSGVLAPLPTPLTDDGSSISEVRLQRLLRRLQDSGVSGYVVCGEVGEFGAISYSDRKALTEMIVRATSDAPQVIVNVSTLSTVASLDLAQHAARHGARACVLMPPYYGTLTPKEIFNFFRVVAQYAGLPVIVVDPNGVLDAEIRNELAAVTGLFLAGPTFWSVKAIGIAGRPTVDEFAVDPGAATVLSLLKPVERLFALPEEEIQELARFVCLHGGARVAKAACEMMGMDLGPLRGPRLPLAQEPSARLRMLLGIEG